MPIAAGLYSFDMHTLSTAMLPRDKSQEATVLGRIPKAIKGAYFCQ